MIKTDAERMFKFLKFQHSVYGFRGNGGNSHQRRKIKRGWKKIKKSNVLCGILLLLILATNAEAMNMTCADINKMKMPMRMMACKSHMGLDCCKGNGQPPATMQTYSPAYPTAHRQARPRTVRTRPRRILKR